jgi:hypothetical protein
MTAGFPGRRPIGHVRFWCLLLVFGFCTWTTGLASGTPDDDETSRKPDTTRRKVEDALRKSRATLQQRQAELGRRLPGLDRARAKNARKAAENWKPRAETARQRAATLMAYRFSPGQTFAYRIDIRVERKVRTEWYQGTPVFTVREVDESGNAELFVIGRLAYFDQRRGAEDFSAHPGRDVWLGTKITLDASGRRLGGKDDYNEEGLPDSLTALVMPRQLFFVELPLWFTDRPLVSESNAMLWTSSHPVFNPAEGRSPLAIGAPATLSSLGLQNQMIEGREMSSLQAEPLSPTLVRIRKQRGFRSKEGPLREMRYEGTSRFDRERGLVLDTEATYTRNDGGTPEPVRISVRLLEGDDLKRAVASSREDWSRLPRELDPIEYRRVRLDVKDLPRLKSAQGLQPGTAVAHFRGSSFKDGDNRWYLAEVVEVIDAYKLKVRYRGSDEVAEAHPGQLAIAPALKNPGP